MDSLIAASFLFLLWIELFPLEATMIVKSIQFKQQVGNNNVNAIKCAASARNNEFVASKMSQNNSGQCQALTRDWSVNKQYDVGYDYIEKQKVTDEFKPPLQLFTDYKWHLPIVFDVGASLILYITFPELTEEISINIFDSVNVDSTTKLVHLVFRLTQNYIHVNSYSNGSWGSSGETVKNLTALDGNTYKIVFEALADIFKSSVGDVATLDLPHAVPPKTAARLELNGGGKSLLLLHNITMIGV